MVTARKDGINIKKIKMYRKIKNTTTRTGLLIEKLEIGEAIHEKVRRLINNKEPISDSAPRIYTEKKDGTLAAYDIRTDKWDILAEARKTEAMGNIEKSNNKLKIVKDPPAEGTLPKSGDSATT